MGVWNEAATCSLVVFYFDCVGFISGEHGS